MKKKNIFFSALCLLGASVFSLAAVSSGDLLRSVHGTTGTQLWNHYSGVAPTFESDGIKEYWVSCSDPAHTILFEEPTGNVVITDKGTPTAEFIEALAEDDSRLIARYSKAISFEDGVLPSYLTVTGQNTYSIDSEKGSDGTHSLKIEMSGDGNKVALDKTFMQALFDLPGSPEAILFDVKATKSIGNDTAKIGQDFYYESRTDAWNTGRYDKFFNTGVTFNGIGIATYWKTFSITRDIFADMTDNCIFLWVDNNSGTTLWIDNIRVGNDFNNSKLHSFEHNSLHFNGSSFEGLDNRADWQGVFRVTAENPSALNVSYSDAYSSEGKTSLHITTSSATKVMFYITSEMYNEASDKGIAFDIYTVTGTTHIDEDWLNRETLNYFGPSEYLKEGKWTTFIAPKECISSSYLMLFRTDEAKIYDLYIDNVRVIDDVYDFESSGTFNNGTDVAAATSNFSAAYDEWNIVSDIFAIGTGVNAEITSERSSTNARSLKIQLPANQALYFHGRLFDRLGDEGIAIDFYCETAVNLFHSKADTSIAFEYWNGSGLGDHVVGTWQTLIFTKEMMTHVGWAEYYRLFLVYADVTIYIDNVRPAPVTETLNQSILNQDVDYTW